MQCRGYSIPLQRAITDFGADNAFDQVSDKLLEHYGINVPSSSVVKIVERHAHLLSDEDVTPEKSTTVVPLTLIAEMDGSMIQLIQERPDDAPADKRKFRKTEWKEARLSLVRCVGEIEPIFAVVMGEGEIAGASMKNLAIAAGLNKQTHVHGVGDGALWIAEQTKKQFGEKGSYLIDFYHLCEYLGAAAPTCAPQNTSAWMDEQKEKLKTGKLNEVITELAGHLESDRTPSGKDPVRACHRYITNRPEQFEYSKAIASDLPIGSGEVESAHRYVIQKRLKLPGASWERENAKAMLKLRTLRANHLWDCYWQDKKAA